MPFFAAAFGLVAALSGAASHSAGYALARTLPEPGAAAMVAAGFGLIIAARRARSFAVAD